MLLWDRGPRALLGVLLESTGKLYVSEIIERSTLGEATIYRLLDRLRASDVVVREEEGLTFDSNRAPRVYYSISPELIDYLRLD